AGEVAQFHIDLDKITRPVAGASLESVVGWQRIVVAETPNPAAETHLLDLQPRFRPDDLRHRVEFLDERGPFGWRDPVEIDVTDTDGQHQQAIKQRAGGGIKRLKVLAGFVIPSLAVTAQCCQEWRFRRWSRMGQCRTGIGLDNRLGLALARRVRESGW